VTHQFGELPDVPGVGLQVPRAEGAPEIVGLYVLLLYAALSDPGVEPSPQGVLGEALPLLAQEEVGGGTSPKGSNSSLSLR